jgi:ATP-dependent Lon protease
MTGEISLQVWCCRLAASRKVVAAAAAGLARVMLRRRVTGATSMKSPQGAREVLQFVWLERVDDAIAEALEEVASWPWLRNDLTSETILDRLPGFGLGCIG